MNLQAEFASNALGKGPGGMGIAVDQEYALRPAVGRIGPSGLGKIGQPGGELVDVRVGGEAGDRSHLAAHSEFLVVDPRRLAAGLQVSSEGALRLVADEQQGA